MLDYCRNNYLTVGCCSRFSAVCCLFFFSLATYTTRTYYYYIQKSLTIAPKLTSSICNSPSCVLLLSLAERGTFLLVCSWSSFPYRLFATIIYVYLDAGLQAVIMLLPLLLSLLLILANFLNFPCACRDKYTRRLFADSSSILKRK